ncbi:MAG: hypothetical protein A370_00656 [Clostridium sp. Maddingley MBC34-26]|nr:MAG: hypothetical protein A370_00656 [Clostridium sp. Maddingley MBC34-26]
MNHFLYVHVIKCMKSILESKLGGVISLMDGDPYDKQNSIIIKNYQKI